MLLATFLSGILPEDVRINGLELFTGAQKEEVLFVGDVLLARDIERKADAYGESYSFHRIASTLRGYRHVVANFEGAMPRKHVPTPDLAMRFSVQSSMAHVLHTAGITIATLANNHANDFGLDAFTHTQERLREAGIVASGAPHGLSTEDIVYMSLGRKTVALIPIHATWSYPAHGTVDEVLAEAARTSDFQVVSIHWGTEYVATPNEAQRAFAHTLVSLGADAVIGHHPHVVQSVEVFETVPIFYSLGNFVFDQYAERETQEGLMVAIGVENNALAFTLIPVTSMDVRGAPRVMNPHEQEVFFAQLEERSPCFSEISENVRRVGALD